VDADGGQHQGLDEDRRTRQRSIVQNRSVARGSTLRRAPTSGSLKIDPPVSSNGVIDFDTLARDPADPKHIKAEYNSGDNLHPNDAPYEAMAYSIDLGMLKGNK
jgi:hypothetical protein